MSGSSAKVVLNDLRDTDSDRLFAWINDPETVRFNAAFSPVSRQDHDAWFASIRTRDDRVIWAIREDGEGPAIGALQLIDIHPVHRTAELIIRIGEADKRDQGLGGAALRQALDKAFGELSLHRVWLRVFATNVRAIRAYERAGFRREGVLRSCCWIDEAWVDQVVMGILADEAS